MADRQLTPPLVSITIPCYHQLDHARRAVDCLRAQTLTDLEITLLDDGASDAYRDYVAALGDPRVRYQRNPERLGAMHNMFQAIGAGRGRYTIAFHEDDLVGTHYLATAVSILERDPRCGFVAGILHEFTDEPPPAALAAPADPPSVVLVPSPADFLRQVFRGIEPMFGSIVYRRAALDGAAPQHEQFATLADRPFLLRILERWSGAIVVDPLVWYRKHGESDIRHLAMNGEHILRLLQVYRDAFPRRLSATDRALFYGYTGYWLFTLYRLVPPESRPPLRPFVFRAWREGLYDPRWSAGYGRKRLIRLMLTGRA
jgi:glycosyltransferase involved in cell wall biosynthesis